MAQSRTHLKTLVFVMFTSAMLTACDADNHGDFAPICPHVDVLPAASDLYQFGNGRQDLSALTYHAAIEGVLGSCAAAPDKAVRSRMSVKLVITRGANNERLDFDLPYFVAVTHDNVVRDKKTFLVHVSMPQDASRVVIRTPLRFIDVPASPDLQDTNYALKVGLQLTPEQVAYNRSHLIFGHFQKNDD